MKKMTSERIKEIQQGTAYPDSISVMLALKQVWNECEQSKNNNINKKTIDLESRIPSEPYVKWLKEQIDVQVETMDKFKRASGVMPHSELIHLDKVTRVEVIDEQGRKYD